MQPKRYQRLKQVLKRRQPDLTVLMENVHKPHNLSAIIRSCDAVGVFEVHAVNYNQEIPTYSQVAQGSDKWVRMQTHDHLKTAISSLKQGGFKIYAAHLSENAVNYVDVDYTQPTAILLGTEKWGVSQEATLLVDGHIIIPMMGMVQSLNVSVAAAVILFEAQRQRLEAGFYEQVRLDPETYKKMIFEWGYPEIAAIYKQQGKPYPNLGSQGEILDSR